jgi:hypothetical protein
MCFARLKPALFKDAIIQLEITEIPGREADVYVGSENIYGPASADWHANNDTPAAATDARTLFRETELVVTGSSDAPRAVNDEKINLFLDIMRLSLIA